MQFHGGVSYDEEDPSRGFLGAVAMETREEADYELLGRMHKPFQLEMQRGDERTRLINLIDAADFYLENWIGDVWKAGLAWLQRIEGNYPVRNIGGSIKQKVRKRRDYLRRRLAKC